MLFHALPAEPPAPRWAALVSAACLPVVPFFFIAAGYFLRSRGGFGIDLVTRPFRRLLPIYAFWMLAYCLLLQIIPLRPWSFALRDWFWGGTAYHLWFLPSLAFAMAFVGGGQALVGRRLTGLACLTLAVFSILDGPYHDLLRLPGGRLFHDSQLAAPLYVFIGTMLARRTIAIGWWWIAAVIVFAYVICIGENLLIGAGSHQSPGLCRDMLLSSFIMGPALFVLARTIPASRLAHGLAYLGETTTLSIYAMHLFLLWWLLPIIGNSTPWQVSSATMVVFGLATAISLILRRIPLLRAVT